jgi:UDP-N-acetylmuramate--alanine ligase
MAKLLASFREFAAKIPFYGFVVGCGDGKNVRRILKGLNRTYFTYGFGPGNRYRLAAVHLGPESSSGDVLLDGKKIARIELSLMGKHMLLNALAGLVAAHQLGLKMADVVGALGSFSGVRRRLELKGQINGITVIDDYGHHPSEIAATLAAVRQRYGRRRLLVLFQPHRYSRTKLLYKKFPAAFSGSDYVEIMDIYPAGEKIIKGVNAEMIIRQWRRGLPPVKKFGGVDNLKKCLKKGDVVLTLGAGSVYKIGEKLINKLK